MKRKKQQKLENGLLREMGGAGPCSAMCCTEKCGWAWHFKARLLVHLTMEGNQMGKMKSEKIPSR